MDAFKAHKHPRKRLNFMCFFYWAVALELVGYFLGQITQVNLSVWYHSLIKSTLTPPPITFAIVWPALYLLLYPTRLKEQVLGFENYH